MNTSYDPFRITNAYGLFGTITRERNEVVIQGTLSEDPLSPDATWLEYEFTCKPGNLNRYFFLTKLSTYPRILTYYFRIHINILTYMIGDLV